MITIHGYSYPAVVESLKTLDKCPECGISWVEVEEMVHGPEGSWNYLTAQIIFDNCAVCRLRFQDYRSRNPKILKRNIKLPLIDYGEKCQEKH